KHRSPYRLVQALHRVRQLVSRQHTDDHAAGTGSQAVQILGVKARPKWNGEQGDAALDHVFTELGALGRSNRIIGAEAVPKENDHLLAIRNALKTVEGLL